MRWSSRSSLVSDMTACEFFLENESIMPAIYRQAGQRAEDCECRLGRQVSGWLLRRIWRIFGSENLEHFAQLFF